jgi:enediyne polyketide synthase
VDSRIAIIGMACRFSDSCSTTDLWNNVLAQRRGFRLFPRERLDLREYWSSDPRACDFTNARCAAFIEDYEFDRLRFKIAAESFRSADLVHWLALDVATAALVDAGFGDGASLNRQTTGVFVGNTLTGEFSRAGILRQRWPYVCKVVSHVLLDEGWDTGAIATLVSKLEPVYKMPFPIPGPDSLAGSLSNTIAGRICNYHDFNGGGYAVDGACSSSLLAVIEGSTALLAGDLDVAVVGGVDLSLDPFELVGFSRAGAIASESMRVFDAHPTGFLPGEGCGFVVLQRYEDAVASEQRIYSVLRGWGISSDGAGGLTRPEIEGQRLAIRRAYRRAGFPISEVDYFEAHGTGTGVGDTVELQTLIAERVASGASKPATIGSIKALIGHTKAAAGMAGLIKASLAVWHGVLPPSAGFIEVHPEIRKHSSVLQLSTEPKFWQSTGPRRAGVSSMGFGGINTHIVLEETPADIGRPPEPAPLERFVSADCELFLLSAANHAALLTIVEMLIESVPGMSLAELGDLAAALQGLPVQELRAAIVATTPEDLQCRLLTLRILLEKKIIRHFDAGNATFLATGEIARIGFLFSGQASPVHRDAGVLRKHFPEVRSLYSEFTVPTGDDSNTAVAQPAIVASSLAGAAALEDLGIEAHVGLGHSVGEIAALCWAGALSRKAALTIAMERGRCMAQTAGGSMLSVGATVESVATLCAKGQVEIAAINSPKQTVVSGNPDAIARVQREAQAAGWHTTLLPVSHAFHSRMMTSAVEPFRATLARQEIGFVQRNLYSTVTGNLLPRDADLSSLLLRQLTTPVRFQEALLEATATGVDLLIEVGPGSVLTGLCKDSVTATAIALNSGSQSHFGLLTVAAAAFALGAPIDSNKLFRHRFHRPMEIGRPRTFLANPCQSTFREEHVPSLALSPNSADVVSSPFLRSSHQDPVLVVRELVAEATELPLAQIGKTDRMLDDLRLNSIVVAEIAARAALALGTPPLQTPTSFSNATIEQLAEGLMLGNNRTPEDNPISDDIAGLAGWVRCFSTEYLPEDLLRSPSLPHDIASWTLHISNEHPLRQDFERIFSRPGAGIVFCISPGDEGECVAAMLNVVQQLRAGDRFVCVHHGGGYSAFLRSVYRERSELTIGVVRVPLEPISAELAYCEAVTMTGFVEAWYDERGARKLPRIRVLPVEESLDVPLTPKDVLLVTGGAKGIGAECALSLARHTGVRPLLVGRSSLDEDSEVSRNILRFSAAGIPFLYVQCDVTDRRRVTHMLAEKQAHFGKITAVLHAAGSNVPTPLTALSLDHFQRSTAPKVSGLDNILSALDSASLRLCVSFGSIIGRIGMQGNADYAFANEQLRLRMEEWSARFPACRFLTVEWSMWSSVGMAERLNSVEGLARQGLTAISPEQGTRILEHVLSTKELSGALIITGRFAAMPNFPLAGAEIPMVRFLERILRFVPGVEIIAEASLSVDTDLYLTDHRLKETLLFPAVMGIEAMVEAAAALGLEPANLVFENLRFDHPIIASDTHKTKIRLLAFKEISNLVSVTIRSESTDFQLDHFHASLRSGDALSKTISPEFDIPANGGLAKNSSQDFYQGILFQSGRFRRIKRYETLTSTCCRGVLETTNVPWFASYLPSTILWGDPGLRDAMMHVIQACMPAHIIVPLSVERIVRWPISGAGELTVCAQESGRRENSVTYDIDLRNTEGVLVEQWRGAVFVQVERVSLEQVVKSPILVNPYLQRRAADLFSSRGIPLSLEVEAAWSPSDNLLKRLNNGSVRVLRRTDNKPEVYLEVDAPPVFVSASNTEALSIAVQSCFPIGCDVEVVVDRDATLWKAMLGNERFLFCQHMASTCPSRLHELATRLWCIREALVKSGLDQLGAIRMSKEFPDGWIEFECGESIVISWSTELRNSRVALAIAVAANDGKPSMVTRPQIAEKVIR